MKSIWLSFAGNKGSLGVAIVDITDEDIEDARLRLAASHPNAREGADIMYAAVTVAHLHACNPGGEVLSHEVPTTLEAPRFRLMQRPELEALGLIGAKR